MSVVIEVRNPGALVEAQLGIGHVGDVARLLGQDRQLAGLVDQAIVEQVRSALAANQVDADVYATDPAGAPPPAAPTTGNLRALAVKMGVVGGALYLAWTLLRAPQ